MRLFLVITALFFVSFPAIAQDAPPWAYESDNVRRYSEFRSLQLDTNRTDPRTQNNRQNTQNRYIYKQERDQHQQNTALPAYPVFSQNSSPKTQSPSAIEDMYAARIVEPLSQFGYDMFGVPSDDTMNAFTRIDRNEPKKNHALRRGTK